MRMHKILTIARRDYIATVRTKAFVFGLVVAPMLFGGGSIAMSLFKGQPDLKDRHVAIVDHTGVVAGPLVSAAREKNDRELFGKITHQQIAPRYVFEVIAPAADSKDQLLALSDRVRRKQLAAFLEIGKDALRPPDPCKTTIPPPASPITPTPAASTRCAPGSTAPSTTAYAWRAWRSSASTSTAIRA
jgi:hypothetical protein